MDTKLITIEAYTLRLPYCGFREFITRLGNGIAARARQLQHTYGLRFRFVVPPGFEGHFGSDVDYIVLTQDQKKHLGTDPRWTSHIFHLPTQYCTFRSMPGAAHTLITVHDVNFIHNKKGLSLIINKIKVGHRLKSASHLAFISHYALTDTNRYYNLKAPQRIIYNGVTDLTATPRQPVDGLPENYLFHLSNLQPNKNVHLLIDMMRHLPDYTLVIAGVWSNNPSLLEQARQADNIITLDKVTDSQKAWLYANCRAFLFPSQCEGFGLPPLEAMAFGKPAFLSDLTSLPEIGGEEAYYWTELQPERMAQKLTRCLTADLDAAKALRLRDNALRFNWDNCVDQYIRYYLHILGIPAAD